jgi:hypothetical protein
MAIGWLTVLQSVPWSEVISNAPKVAQGARKLWKKVGKQPPAPQGDEASAHAEPEVPTLATLQARVSALEAAVADLHGQMLTSSELITTLAEQNAQLVQRIEANRVRLRWLGFATGVLAVAVIFGLVALMTGMRGMG